MHEGDKKPPGIFNKFFNLCYKVYIPLSVFTALSELLKFAWDHWGKISSDTAELFRGNLPLGAKIMLGENSDPLFFICLIGLIGILFASLALFWIAFHSGQRLLKKWRLHKNAPAFLRGCRDAILETYTARRFEDFDCLQAGMRTLLAVFVLGAATDSLFHRHEEGSPHSVPLIQWLNAFQICLTCGYLISMGAHFFIQRAKLRRVVKSAKDSEAIGLEEKVSEIFWQSAKWDLTYVTLIWSSTLLPERPFHLAFILPMMGTWLFLSHRAQKVFVLVLAALFVHFSVLTNIDLFLPKLNVALGYTNNAVFYFSWELLSLLAFWVTLSVILAVLRRLRLEAKLKAGELDSALKKQSLLRCALETLGVQQKHVVFAKNKQRQFIFANDIFLERLASRFKASGCLLENGRARWEDIEGKTDAQIGIADLEGFYRKSDEQVLESKKPDDDHFEDFEPTYEQDLPEGTMIWTRKDTIRDKSGEIVGLVGCIVPGQPVQVQKMDQYLTKELPIYASMKTLDGHIVWANQRHLEKLEEKINKLLPEDKRDKLLHQPLQARLKAINGGKGPTDVDLYGPLQGNVYRDMDSKILNRAATHRGTAEEFEAVINDLINSDFGHNRDKNYPHHGWMEYHTFPGKTRGCWMEVWKMPWWEERRENGQSRLVLKGILVFFEDKDKAYLRSSVVWRWLEHHIHSAHEANVRLNKQDADGNGLEVLREFRLCELLRRMLLWFRSFVDENENEFPTPCGQRFAADISTLLTLVEESYGKRVKVNFSSSSSVPVLFKRHGDELYAIIIALVMNAIEATIQSAGERRSEPLPPVLVEMLHEKKSIVLRVLDKGRVLDQQELDTINHFKKVNIDRMPGGGFFIAKRLTQRLLYGANVNPLNAPNNSYGLHINQNVSGKGAVVTVRLPDSIFE